MTHLTIIGIKRIHIQKSKSSIKTPLPHFITFGFPYGKRISRSRDPNTYTHRHTHRQLRSYSIDIYIRVNILLGGRGPASPVFARNVHLLM